jgi:hypothetical protein
LTIIWGYDNTGYGIERSDGDVSLAELSNSELLHKNISRQSNGDQATLQCNGDVGNLDSVDDGGTSTAAFAPAITLTPTSVTVADNVPAGTVRAAATATMSDRSQVSGTLTISNTDFFVISGLDMVTARALTSADDGATDNRHYCLLRRTMIVHEFSI